jgi:hypothetical protein
VIIIHIMIKLCMITQSKILHLSIPAIDVVRLLPLSKLTVIKAINTIRHRPCFYHWLCLFSFINIDNNCSFSSGVPPIGVSLWGFPKLLLLTIYLDNWVIGWSSIIFGSSSSFVISLDLSIFANSISYLGRD